MVISIRQNSIIVMVNQILLPLNALQISNFSLGLRTMETDNMLSIIVYCKLLTTNSIVVLRNPVSTHN